MAFLRDNPVKKNVPLFLIAKVRVSVPISSQNFQNGKSEFDYLVSKGGKKNYKGICHGTRIGKEVEWFNRYLPSGSHVFGTDIEPSAKKFANTIEHDFHEIKTEWLNCFDFNICN